MPLDILPIPADGACDPETGVCAVPPRDLTAAPDEDLAAVRD
ncbi:hypothetical protein [Microbispora sp. ATCC PTA-5024]|nr:hypothetical protein [Microbispora sp. ATCC PTA-5024]ETK30715.1 hypothetical protein MPTA5024_38775 [Microbispora sp. ATCC PTA-5024]